MKKFEVVFTKYFSYYVEAEDADDAIDVAEEIFRTEMRTPIADTTYDEVDTYRRREKNENSKSRTDLSFTE